jgi:uncharacterized membrane protein YgcG
MQARKFRILSAITAGSLALAVVGITASFGTVHTARHAALAAQTGSSPPVNLDACPVLHTGYPQGGCVIQLQTDLRIVQDPNLGVDGIFGSQGSQTYKAVIAFQQAHHLPQDGMVGPATKQALGLALSGDSVPTPEVPSTTTPGTSTSGTSTVITTPAYTVVRYLQHISVPSCVANLIGAKIAAAGALCAFLANSANEYPPNDLSGTALSGFIAKKQYRQYVNYPSYSVTCVDGTIQNISSPPTSAPFSWSLGYTRIQGPGNTNYFSLGEPFTENDNFDRTSPDEIYHAGKSSVEIDFQAASRLATAERGGNYALTALDAPFIWTEVTEDVSCSGTYGLTVATDTVPTTDIYINGHEVSYDKQSTNLGQFSKEGGGTLNPVGYGNLAYPCHVKHFNAQGQLDDSFTGCGSGFQGFQGGQSGGGGASGSW